MSLTVGITDCKKWDLYKSWLSSFGTALNIIRLKAGESTMEQVRRCNGIILSGGEDVHPSLCNKPEYIEQFGLSDFNKERDDFEFAVLKEIIKNNIPLLGICRGLQITNVFFKGTLIPDLPRNGKNSHRNPGEKKGARHPVRLVKNSRIYAVTGEEQGIVNSFHHQAADSVGKGLKATALSEDGVVEGIEKADKKEDTFFVLVQWHPERMEPSNPFSGKLREAFVKACNRQTITV